MARPVVIFEDDRVADLYPLTLTRPAFDLVCGVLSLREKTVRGLGDPSRFRFHVRDYLGSPEALPVDSYARLSGDGMVTLVNARVLWRDDLLRKIDLSWVGRYLAGGDVVLANLPLQAAASLDRHLGRPLAAAAFADLPSRDIVASLVAHPWDLIGHNGDEIARDFRALGGPGLATEPPRGVHLVKDNAIRIAGNVRLSPGVVVDASEGPVNIDAGAVVMANASLRGPLHVGANTVIKMGAAIYGPTSIGPVCKVGGEIDGTIIHGYSNKQHQGFVGHSYIGEWVNIGAGTNTSDMKNNYSTVRVPVGGGLVDSGQMFVGLFMGDHSKSGIGTVFNAGTSVGACCNIYGEGYPPKSLPSFTWGGVGGFVEHGFGEALETARRAMGRRGRALDARAETVLKMVFELSAAERAVFLGR
jgi:UDP-N-acetylglucosamine diphosphorylase/glucosamine-1-phosphate N-acetyltransferase